MDREFLERKILYRSSHRGTKEADALLGGFFRSVSSSFTVEQLVSFGKLVEESDADIMDWLKGEKKVPKGQLSEIIRSLELYYKNLLNN